MSQIALNNLSSLAGAAIGSSTAGISGNSRGFDDHLQRASQDGSDAAGAGDDSAPSWTSPANDCAPESQPAADPKPAKDSRPSQSPAPQSEANANDRQAEKCQDKSTSPNEAEPNGSRDKRHGGREPAQSATATAQVAAEASAAVQPAHVAVSVPTVSQADVSAQIAIQAANQDGKSTPVVSPTATNVAATGTTAQQSAAAAAAPPQESANFTPTSPTEATAAEAAQATAGQADLANQQPQQPASSGGAVGVVAQTATATAIASVLPNPAKIAGKPVAQSVGASNTLHATADQPKSARAEREATSAQRSPVSSPSAEAQAAAVAVAASGAPTDLPAGDASAGATHKDAVAPAIDNVAAKSQSTTAGQALGNTAAQTKEPANAPSATQSAAGSGASEVDRVRFLQRVSSAFQAADEQGGQIRLRLSPPELGSMRLELSVRNGMMTAHVQTETDAARNMLLDHLPQLRDRLAEHNIKIDHFNVELTNRSRNGTPQNFAGNANQRQQTGPDGAARPRASGGGSALAAAPATTIRTVNGRLDVTV